MYKNDSMMYNRKSETVSKNVVNYRKKKYGRLKTENILSVISHIEKV